MIIEPCCCHKQLPPLCRENTNRITIFHTNGDVTIEKIFHAVGCLVGSSVATIITPYIDNTAKSYLKYCLERNWISHLNILIAPSKEKVSFGSPERVTVIEDKRISEASAMFVLEGKDMRLCITGYLPPISPADSNNVYRLCSHTLLYTNSEPPQSLIWDELTKIPLAPFRTRKVNK